MKMTKEQFYFRMGFYSCMHVVEVTEGDCKIAWQGYLTLPENATAAQMDALASKIAVEMLAVQGSVKE